MPINQEMYNLDVQSYEASPKDGVLATIGGKFSTSSVPSRNERMYTADLWRSVLQSERVQEMLKTKTFFGELSHPPRPAEFLSEVQMANISHNIIDLKFNEQSQDLMGKIDILDTPSGRIANTLVKYGSKIGISSRGIVMDDNRYGTSSGNTMTPENYYLVTFDLVALPGIMGARLDAVAESFSPQFALESLSELRAGIEQATANHDESGVAVLKSIVESVSAASNLAGDPEIQKAIQDLTARDSAADVEPEETQVEADVDVIDREDVDKAILEDADESLELDEKKNYFLLITEANLTEDGIYDIVTKQPIRYYDGYQVVISLDVNVGEAAFNQSVSDLIDLTAEQPALSVVDGVCKVSVRVAELKQATRLAKRYKQQVIFDWANDKEIPIVTKPEVKPVVEDDSGATQVSDIEGPVSTVNVLGPDTDVKRFLESFDGIATVDDVTKFIESLEGVEAQDGKLIINKDTALFNAMLTLINSARLHSDANPLLQPGGPVTQMAANDEKPEERTDAVPEPGKTVPLKKSIDKDPDHKSVVEAMRIADRATRRLERIARAKGQLEVETETLRQKNAALKERLITNHVEGNKRAEVTEARIAELTARLAELDKVRESSANESLVQQKSYLAFESMNRKLAMKTESLTRELQHLKHKYDVETGKAVESRRDGRIRRLLEAQTLSVQSIKEDDDARAYAAALESDGISAEPSDSTSKVVDYVTKQRRLHK